MSSSSAGRIGFNVRMALVASVVFLLLTSISSRCWASGAAEKYPPTIVFMTDFGVLDDSVAIAAE